MPTIGVVTGAGRGMGYACAQRLASWIDVLVLVDIDNEAVATAAKQLAGNHATTEPFALDITDRDGLDRLREHVEELGSLRAVAHAAGISPTMADWRRILTVDLVGTALLAEALRPLAVAGTATVCFASMAGVLNSAEHAEADAALDHPLAPDFLDRLHAALGDSVDQPGTAYSWAKRGVQRFVRQEAMRLGKVAARINSISPGIIDTPQGRQEAEAHEVMKVLTDQSALQREGQPDELAAAVNFLLSDEASFVTGTDLLVDGGVCAGLWTSSTSAADLA